MEMREVIRKLLGSKKELPPMAAVAVDVSDKERLYMRRKFCVAYLDFLEAEREKSKAEQRHQDAFKVYMAWTDICRANSVSAETPYAGEVVK